MNPNPNHQNSEAELHFPRHRLPAGAACGVLYGGEELVEDRPEEEEDAGAVDGGR